MHSMHTIQTQTHQANHQDPSSIAMQDQQQHQHQHQMTVLETLNPSNQQAPQVDRVMLVDGGLGQQPLLHQLEPNHNRATAGESGPDTLMTVNQHHEHEQQVQTEKSLAESPHGKSACTIGMIHDGGPIVHWLLDKYEIADGESLPRSTVYNHYLAHCRSLRIASVNAASFGKIIRSVFLGLKTRRLGTRGHSKYHYFGVRAKKHVQQELLQYGGENPGNNENSNQNMTDNGSDETDSIGNVNDANNCNGSLVVKRVRRTSSSHQQDTLINQATNGTSTRECSYYSNSNGFTSSESQQQIHANYQHHQHIQHHYDLADFRNHLGANWATLVDEHWPTNNQQQQQQQQQQQVPVASSNELNSLFEIFEMKYKFYYKQMVELLSELKFANIEQLWQEFWQPGQTGNEQPGQQQQWQTTGSKVSEAIATVPVNSVSQSSDITMHHVDYHHHLHQKQDLTFHELYQLTSQPQIIDRINLIDYTLYSAIESFLLPDMLSPIPRSLAKQIQSFAKNIGTWIEMAVKDYDLTFIQEKSKSARAFGSTLKMYTSLNYLSTASRAIWEKRSSLAQMSVDLSRVDLRDIEHQLSLMSNQSGNETNQQNHESNEMNQHQHNHLSTIQPGQLIQNFLHLLEDPYPANSWPDWCRNLVESRVCGLSTDEAKNFVLRWHFYISLIMKELTLKSAPSFGSFQLIRLLFDDYIFYLVVSRLAQAQNKTTAQALLSL